ncbi:Hypothetical predicted protein, partial [Paramuricea clavata]
EEEDSNEVQANGRLGNDPRVVTVQTCDVSYRDVKRDDPAEDDDSSSDHGANSTTESEDEEEFNGIVLQWASKLKRRDSLASKLNQRPSKHDLEERNILP